MFDIGTFDLGAFDFSSLSASVPAGGGGYTVSLSRDEYWRKKKRWKRLTDEEEEELTEAVEAVEEKAERLKPKQRGSLEEAARLARQAIELDIGAPSLVRALESIVEARKAADAVKRSFEALEIAREMVRAARQAAEDDDEEALLMMGIL